MNIFGNGFMTIAEVDLYQAYEDAEDFKRNSQKKILHPHMGKEKVESSKNPMKKRIELETKMFRCWLMLKKKILRITPTKPTIRALII